MEVLRRLQAMPAFVLNESFYRPFCCLHLVWFYIYLQGDLLYIKKLFQERERIMATSANLEISLHGKKLIKLESDIAYKDYSQAALDVSDFLISKGIDCFLKSWGSDGTPPVLTIDEADFELHLTRHFLFPLAQEIHLKRVS